MLGASTSLQEQACLVPYLTYWAPAGPFHSSTQEPHNLITSFQITGPEWAVLRILFFWWKLDPTIIKKNKYPPHSDSNFKPAVKFTSVVQVSTFEHTRLVLPGIRVSIYLFSIPGRIDTLLYTQVAPLYMNWYSTGETLGLIFWHWSWGIAHILSVRSADKKN